MIILIIEDQEPEAELIREYLAPLGIPIEICLTFAAGLAVMMRNPPADIIFLDLLLPDTHGYSDTLDRIKQLKKHNPNAVVIAMTGMQGEQIAKIALTLGATEFHYKKQLNSQTQLFNAVKRSIERTPKTNEDLLEKLNQLLTPI